MAREYARRRTIANTYQDRLAFIEETKGKLLNTKERDNLFHEVKEELLELWSQKEQRYSEVLEFNNKSQTVLEWSKELDLDPGVIVDRLIKGFDISDVLSLEIPKWKTLNVLGKDKEETRSYRAKLREADPKTLSNYINRLSDERDRRIMTFIYVDNKTQAEVARIEKISRQRINKLEEAALIRIFKYDQTVS